MFKIISSIMLIFSIATAIDLNTSLSFSQPSVMLLNTFKSGEPLSGLIVVKNNTSKKVTSKVFFSIIGENGVTYNSKFKYAEYSVPAFTENTYKFINGPSITVKKDTFVHILAKNKNGQVISKIKYLILAK